MWAWGLLTILISLITQMSHGSDFNDEGGGTIVPKSKYPQVIQIKTEQGACTATIVGPNVILTAAHCGYEKDENYENVIPEGKKGWFYLNDEKYEFTFLPSSRISKDIRMGKAPDLSVGITAQAISNIRPLSINFKAPSAQMLIGLGYGCVSGSLTETLLKTKELDALKRYMISFDDSRNTYACTGDSGGPTLAIRDKHLEVIGVHVGTDLLKETRDVRSDSSQFITFITSIADQHNLKICGHNTECNKFTSNN